MPRSRFSRRVIQLVAENRILEAKAAGEFDNLPGAGRPIEGIDEPYDPLWWLRKWIRRERLAGAVSGRAWQALRDEHSDSGRRGQGRE